MEQELEDSVSLQDIGLRIWARRGIISVLVVLSGLGVGAHGLLQKGFSGGDVIYFIDLKGIEKGKYPAGASFSPNDLRSPEVLRASLEALELPSSDFDEIFDGLRIEYGSPGTYGIIRKHKERLAVKDLSTAEIDSRNAEFKDELESATRTSVRLALNPSVVGLGLASTRRLLQEIPAQWTRIYSERYRIFEAPGLERSVGLFGAGSLNEANEVIAAIRAIRAMAVGLKAIASDNRVNYLLDSRGNSASALLEQLDVFRAILFRPLSHAVLSKPGPVADSYRLDLRLHVDYLNAQIASFNLVAEQLSGGREGAAAQWAETADSSAVNQLQLSGDSLGTIIGLAEKASGAEFLREILVDRHNLSKEAAETEARLARVEEPSRFVPNQEFIKAAEEQLAFLVAAYEDLYAISIDRLRTELGTLYDVSAVPIQAKGMALSIVVMRMIGAVLAALFVGVLIALVMPDPRVRRLETGSGL